MLKGEDHGPVLFQLSAKSLQVFCSLDNTGRVIARKHCSADRLAIVPPPTA